MSLKFTVAPAQIRNLKNALQCLAKIGSEVLVEAIPERLILRCINSSKSAFMAVTFHTSFFDTYDVFDSGVVQTAVLMKNLLSAFRTPKISRMAVEVATGDEPNVSIRLTCDNGLTKCYVLHCVESEILQATLDKDTFPTSMVAEAAELNRLLSSFHSGLEEITIIANPEGGHGGQQRACELRSFIDPAKGSRDKSLNTAVAVDARTVFRSYRHEGEGSTDVTFNLRDFRAIVALCEHMQANLFLAFDQPGVPLLAQPHFGGVEAVDYEGELVLATLMESQMSSQAAPAQAPDAGVSGMTGAMGAGAPGTSYIPGDTPWRTNVADGRTPISRAGPANGQTPMGGPPGPTGSHGVARPSRLAQSTFSDFPPGPSATAGAPQPSTSRPPRSGHHSGPQDSEGVIRFNRQPDTSPAPTNHDRMEAEEGITDVADDWHPGGVRHDASMEDPHGLPGIRTRPDYYNQADDRFGDNYYMEDGDEDDEEELPPTPPEKRMRSAGPGIISTLP